MDDCKIIKKLYGERMWHYCRSHFSTILEEPGRLSSLFTKLFFPNKNILDNFDYYDNFESIFQAIVLKDYNHFTYNFIDTGLSPFELLKKANYTLYECNSEEEIQAFKKYYAKGEELCTFKGGRLDSSHVFFAVRDDALELNREDFLSPRREDEYGSSVLGIQFSKDSLCYLSIKSRYNHTVYNPDACFGNNLDKIIPGLTKSFENYYGFKQYLIDYYDLPGFVLASDGKYYRYYAKILGHYFCYDNIIIDSKDYYVYDEYNKNKERYILNGYYLIDLQKKKVSSVFEGIYDFNDSFIELESDCSDIKLIKEGKMKKIILTHDYGNNYVYIDENGLFDTYVNENIDSLDYLTLLLFRKVDFDKLKIVKGDLYLPNIVNGSGLDALEHVYGNLDCTSLDDNKIFPALKYVDKDLTLDCSTQLNGLENLVSVGGDLNVPKAVSSAGLDSLVCVLGDAHFDNLKEVEHLNNFRFVGGVLCTNEDNYNTLVKDNVLDNNTLALSHNENGYSYIKSIQNAA